MVPDQTIVVTGGRGAIFTLIVVAPIESPRLTLDLPPAPRLMMDGELLTWFFWTAWQRPTPRYRPEPAPSSLFDVSFEARPRPRVRARRHAPNHSPRRTR